MVIGKKQLGMAVMLVAIVGFVFFSENKSDYVVLDETYGNCGEISRELAVRKGQSYRISVWGIDEETGLQQWGNLKAALLVADSKGEVLCRKSFNASASSSQESGGVRRAQNGTECVHKAQSAEKLMITILFEEGDKVSLQVHENLGDLENMLPGLFLIFGLGGLVLFLKGRSAGR
jgi:hypothetical protein